MSRPAMWRGAMPTLLWGALLVATLTAIRLALVVRRECAWRMPEPDVPAEQVANYRRLRDALARLRPPADRALPAEDWRDDPRDDPALPAARRFVAANTDALVEVRAALAQPCWQPGDWALANEYEEEAAGLRGLTVLWVLLRQQSLVAWADRDWDQAVAALLDGLMLSEALASSSAGRGLMAGASATVFASRLALLTPHLDADRALFLVKRLEAASANQTTVGQQLRREALGNAGMLATPGLGGVGRGLVGALLGLLGPRERHRRTMVWLEALADTVDAPRCQWRLPSTAAFTWGAAVDHLVVRSAESMHRHAIMLRVLLAQTAVEAYRLHRGRYPDQLDELVPDFLAAVPDDGYLPGPLRYRRTADSYVCWSVGPDLTDDGGRPLVKPDWPDMTGTPPPLSEWKGDLVSSNATLDATDEAAR